MKYAITESRLNKFINDYLDSYLYEKDVMQYNNFIIVSEKSQPLDEFSEDCMEFDFSDGRLWISSSLFENLENLFFKDKNETATFVKKWFENKFNVKVEFIQT